MQTSAYLHTRVTERVCVCDSGDEVYYIKRPDVGRKKCFACARSRPLHVQNSAACVTSRPLDCPEFSYLTRNAI